jgi:hypothetical protein
VGNRYPQGPHEQQWPHGKPPTEPHQGHSSAFWVTLFSSPVLAALIAGIFAWSPWNHSAPQPAPPVVHGSSFPQPGTSFALPSEPSVFVNPTSGAGGIVIRVSGEGFPANAHIVIMFHTEQMGDTTSNADGKFSNVACTIPTSFSYAAPQQFYINAVAGPFAAETPFMLTG